MAASLTLVIVDDEEIVRISTADDLRDRGYEVIDFDNAADALVFLERHPVDIVLSDIRMPGMDGLELLSAVKKRSPQTAVIMMTAFGSVETAVEAMRRGAVDYLIKPYAIDELLMRIRRIEATTVIEADNRRLRSQLQAEYDFETVVGHSPAMCETLDLLRIVIDSDATVLFEGETGTGKELMANIVHYNGPRRHQPFIKVSCAILSKEIIESELFGHEKGAFTGAVKDKKGKFELADGGTIYLDDVDDIPLDMQVKLLRVLEEREVETVGGSKPFKIDVRVIASTKVDLKKHVADGRFREDLYYRLNVFPIRLKSLRERSEDITELFQHYVTKFAGRPVDISGEVLEALRRYAWPGNVRELRNLAERTVLMTRGKSITMEELPRELAAGYVGSSTVAIDGESLESILTTFERSIILRALELANHNKTRAAELLKIPPSTLRARLSKLDIK
jgi:two-component system response regulator AtoC